MSYPNHVGFGTFFWDSIVRLKRLLYFTVLKLVLFIFLDNPIQHQCTKHIQMDIYFVPKKVARG